MKQTLQIFSNYLGLTGRQLKIPLGSESENGTAWINPSGKYRIGVKRAIELYPRSLRERMIKEKQEKFWDPPHKLAMAQTTRKINEFEMKQNNSTSNTASSTNSKGEGIMFGSGYIYGTVNIDCGLIKRQGSNLVIISFAVLTCPMRLVNGIPPKGL